MPTCISPRMLSSVLQDGPSVQMIVARRNGAVSEEHKAGGPDGFSVIGKVGGDIVREKSPASSVARPSTQPYRAFSSLPSSDRGNRIALNSVPIRITSEIRYIHTRSAMPTPSDP